MLLILSRNSVLGLLLHTLHEVLHVLEGIDLERYKANTSNRLKHTPLLKCVSFRFKVKYVIHSAKLIGARVALSLCICHSAFFNILYFRSKTCCNGTCLSPLSGNLL